MYTHFKKLFYKKKGNTTKYKFLGLTILKKIKMPNKKIYKILGITFSHSLNNKESISLYEVIKTLQIKKANYNITPIENFYIKKKLLKLTSIIAHPFNSKKRKKMRKEFINTKNSFIPSPNFNAANIPVYIISYNRLSYVQQMIQWLEHYNLKNIHIIDNNSSYPPLLKYLESLTYTVYHMDKNYGHRVFWECGLFDNIIEKSMYILSDPDIAPNDNLPSDFIYELYRILGEHPNITKVGFALTVHDLPNNKTTAVVKKWEEKFWNTKLPDHLDIYLAPIDTTFALYRPGKLKEENFYSGIRVAGKFSAKHIPWYNTNIENEEDIFYKKSANKNSATWTNNIKNYEDKTNA